MKRYLKFIGFPIILFFFCSHAYCTEYYIKQWTTSTIIGSFPQNAKLKYYIEPQLRLINEEYIFNQAFFLTALGYAFSPTMTLFIGPGWVMTKNTEGVTYHEYRLWQQLNWQAMNSSFFTLNSRTRLEEKERSNQSAVAIQLRQRFWARMSIRNTNQYFYSLFDEVFFNLNRPSWAAPRFFEQNRAFIGIGKQLTKETIMDVGYLNQQQFGPPHHISHVLLVSLSITS